MKELLLRTGEVVPAGVYLSVITSLRYLLKNNPVAFVELVFLARDPHHVMFGNTSQDIHNIGLVQNGELHDATRAVILASIEVDESDLRIVSGIQN